jgi:DHA1 family tetracycline resistance protein-like MFS transporter
MALPVFPKRVHRRTLWTLYFGNLLTSVGVWFFLPLLPIFLGRHGGSSALIGAVNAAGLLANAAIRYPAGWAADRFGTRPVIVVSMAAGAALFLAYLLPLPVGAFLVVRFVHGAAAGSFWPAANGLIAELTLAGQRARTFGVMQSTNTAGMLIGPGLGGFIALFDLNVVFVLSALLCGLSTIAVAMLPNVRLATSHEAPVSMLRIGRSLAPLILLGAGISYMIGTLDTVWPLYVTHRGGSTLAVGLSFVSFAIPATLLSAWAGALGDRFGPRRLIVIALVGTAVFNGIYPFVSSVPWLIGLGLVEGVYTIAGTPSLLAEVSHIAEAGYQARTQGLFQTVQTLIQIVGALAGGFLYGLNPTSAFIAISAVCFLGAATTLVPRREPAPARPAPGRP